MDSSRIFRMNEINCTLLPNQTPKKKITLDSVPGDKSISHRAIILGSLAENESRFSNFLFAEDCLNTLAIFQQLGVPIRYNKEAKSVTIQGQGLQGLKQPLGVLDVGNSGTGIRLICGVLAGQSFSSSINGDGSIQNRPMRRVTDPLSQMGARITGCSKEGSDDLYPQLDITGGTSLSGIRYRLPVASAQVKSAVLLAGLFAEGATTVEEPEPCRNHTEVMLHGYGYPITVNGAEITVPGRSEGRLRFPDIESLPIPSDFSSAAFFIVLGLLLEFSVMRLESIGLNRTRAALLDVLHGMGAEIRIEKNEGPSIEPIGAVTCSFSTLSNLTVDPKTMPFIIDEIPILAVAGCFAEGVLRIRGAEELRVKESDRIKSVVAMVKAFGGDITEYDDGFDLIGPAAFRDFEVDSFGDHRIAMSAVIAAAASGKRATIRNIGCINTSFPSFFELLEQCGFTCQRDG